MRDHLLGYPPALDYMGLPPDRPRASYTPPRQRVEPSEQVLRKILDCDPRRIATAIRADELIALTITNLTPQRHVYQIQAGDMSLSGMWLSDKWWSAHDQTMQRLLQAAGAR